MTNIFLSFFEMSVSISFIVAVLILLTPFLSKRYAAKWKYLIWICLALRLLIPFNGGNVQSFLGTLSQTEAQTSLRSEEKDADAPAEEMMPSRRIMIEIPAQMTTPIAKQSEKSSITLLDILAFVWMIGSLVFISMHLASYLFYKRQVVGRGTIIEDAGILHQISELKHELHITGTVRAVEYPEADSPMIIGFLKPVLVLPEEPYSSEEQFFILKHELVHLKRGDVFFKLLFVAANALHWFNPLIWIMQKEAGVDMELSCDERVTRGADYAMRKAYTETLLSTLHRGGTKRAVLSTQFYGGKQIMKKRFKNILAKNSKKNGIAILICAIILTISCGTLLGCTIAKGAAGKEVKYMDIAHIFKPYEQAVEISFQMPEDWKYTIWDVEEESTDWGYSVKVNGKDDATFSIFGQFGTLTADVYSNGPKSFQTSQGLTGQYSWDEYMLDDKNPAIQGIVVFDTELAGFYGVSFNMPKSVYSESKNIIDKLFQSIVIKETGTPIEGTDIQESADIQEMKRIIEEFAAYYFNGDAAALQKYLTSPYEGDIDTYEGSGTADNFTIKGLPDAGERNADNKWEASLEFMDSEEDSYTYLTFSFVKQEDGWKIQSYGLEK